MPRAKQTTPDTADAEEAPPARIVNRTEHNAATSFRDNAGGPPKVNEPQQGRPNDLGTFEAPHPLGGNSTLAERRAKRLGEPWPPEGTVTDDPDTDTDPDEGEEPETETEPAGKKVDAANAENKAVGSADTK